MSATYSIDVDVARNLVRITLAGFFTAEEFAGFVAARNAAHARLTCGRNQHVTINDVRRMKIQSQDMVVAFQQMLADPAHASRRLAFVTAPTLARTQLLRALGDRGAEVFDSHAAAEAWVFADERAAA
jgi:hypothetical protein